MALKITFSHFIPLILALSLFLLTATSFSQPLFFNMEIEDVRFEGLGGISKDTLTPLMYVKKGERYSSADIRRSVKHLYLKGLFSQVYVEASEGKEGVILTFHLEPKSWISVIDIKGNREISDRDILPFLPIKEGGEFNEKLLSRIEDKMKELYKKEGYFNTRVSSRFIKKDNAVRLLIEVREGRPCLLTGIVFKGDKPFGDKKLVESLDSRVGKPVNPVLLEKDRDNIAGAYQDAGYPEAQISEPRITFDIKRERATAYFEIKSGPEVEIAFTGNSYFSDKDLIRIIKHRAGRTISPGLVKKWEKKIAEAYRQAGYPFVAVKGDVKIKEGKKKVVLIVDEGKRYFIGRIIFRGNRALKTRTLLKRITLKGGFFKKPFHESSLDSNVERINHLYIKNGFLNASIKREVHFDEASNRVDITVSISEGIQTVIGSINFSGITAFEKDELLGISGIREGEPLNLWRMENATLRIIEAYSKEGYVYVSVIRRERFSGNEERASVEFDVREGLQVSRGKVILEGNRFTKDHVILRELTLGEGEPFDPKRILEDRQRVYRLGLFRGVKYSQLEEERKEAVKDMLLQVRERKAGAVELGIGYATDIGMRGFLEISYLNLGGTARSVRIRGEASGIENKVLVGYKEPWLMGRRIDGRVNILHQSTEKDSYELEKNGIILAVDKEVSDFSKLSLQYEMESNRYFNVAPGTSQEEGKSTLVSIGPVLIRDSRDDPFNTRKGSVNILKYELADEAIGSDREFRKITAQSSWYYPVTSKSVGAVSLRLGYIDLIGSTQSVPIDRRFFLGGRTTIRGYREDSVGPVNQAGSPIGGERMINVNAESRTTLAGNLGALLFWDGGYVWKKGEGISLSDMRTSVGAGIRYITPIGPLSLEYGHKISRKPGESPGEWYFTIGNIF